MNRISHWQLQGKIIYFFVSILHVILKNFYKVCRRKMEKNTIVYPSCKLNGRFLIWKWILRRSFFLIFLYQICLCHFPPNWKLLVLIYFNYYRVYHVAYFLHKWIIYVCISVNDPLEGVLHLYKTLNTL